MKKKYFNLFLVFSIFFNLFINTVPIVSASPNQTNVSDEMIFGSLINASQGGRSSGYNADIDRAGGSYLGGQRKGGSRIPNLKRGGGKVGFNPTEVDINILYNDYSSFLDEFDYSDKFYYIPINKVFSRHERTLLDENYTHGIQFVTKQEGLANIDYHKNTLFIPTPYKSFKYIYFINSNLTPVTQRNHIDYITNGYYGFVDYKADTIFDATTMKEFHQFSLSRYSDKSNHVFKLKQINSADSFQTSSWSLSGIVFSNYSDITLDDILFAHDKTNKPTKQEFINNYTNTFNVSYDKSTNQLIKSDKYYTYNISDFTDNSITINGDYIVVNGDYIEGSPDDVSKQLNYTSLLNKIIDAIKDLPQEIKKILPDFVTETGTNIWDFLTEIVKTLGSIGESIIEAFVASLELIIESIISLVIPSDDKMALHKTNMSELTSELSAKFDFIMKPIKDLSNVFSSPKSFHDVSFNFFGVQVYVLPEMFIPVVSKFKPVLNGTVVIITFIYLYKKSQPDEVIT